MGCDIHLFVEVKRSYPNPTALPEWKAVGRVFTPEYCKPDEITTIDDDGYEWNNLLTNEPYQGRNYDLFAILADVRNGRGFAGCDTGDGFDPISKPRGIPEDASDFYKKEVKEWGVDGHSHSWLTLNEIKNFDWNKTTKHRGWVDIAEYKSFKKNGKPESWSGGVSGRMVEHISNAEMDRRIAEDNLLPEVSYYTLVEWQETYAQSVGDFLTKTIPQIEALLTKKYVEDLRLVFFFDN